MVVCLAIRFRWPRVCRQSTQRRCFWSKIHVCGVKNARKVFNLAALFALHTRFLPQKTASLVKCRQTLGNLKMFAAGTL